MAEGVKVNVGANVGFCNGSSTSAEECQIAEGQAEVQVGGVILERLGTAAALSSSAYIGQGGSFEPDPTYLPPVEFAPTGDHNYRLEPIKFTFIPFIIGKKGASGEVKAKHDNLVPSFVISQKGGQPAFIPYATLGAITVEPSDASLRPDIKHPFSAVISGEGVPSTLAVRTGIQEIVVNKAIRLNVEYGRGMVSGQTGPLGSNHSASGWSILTSGSVIMTDWIKLRGGFRHTRRNALQEPALNQFRDGKGETRQTGVYGVAECGERWRFYGGRIENRSRSKEGEAANDQFRVMSYGAVAVSLPWEMKIALMRGWQVFTEGDLEAQRGRMEGELTSLQVTKDFGHGVSFEVLGFRQKVDGEKLEMGGEGEPSTLNPIDFAGSGGMGVLRWEFGL